MQCQTWRYREVQLHNVIQYGWFKQCFFFKHPVISTCTQCAITSYFLVPRSSVSKLCHSEIWDWVTDRKGKKSETVMKWKKNEKGSKQTETLGVRMQDNETETQVEAGKQIEQTNRSGGWRRGWVIELERGKHSILLTSLEDAAETWSQPGTGHRSTSLCLILLTRAHTHTRMRTRSQTHTQSHILSCNTAPGIFLKLTEHTLYLFTYTHTH